MKEQNEAMAVTDSKRPRTFGGLVLFLLLGATGCAFMSKGEALSPRYFSPALEPVHAPADGTPSGPAAPAEAATAPPELRVGRIEPAAHLEERIAYRVSETELGYYDDRLWTEPPEQFVRRALDSELFETHAFRRVVAGVAPTLDVEVLSFEELRQGSPRARLSLLITLRDERHALLERTISVEVPLVPSREGEEGPALAAAMSSALSRATKEIAQRVSAELDRSPAATPVAPAAHSLLDPR
jgi:cholesterol transport system auxiliary component